jgi:hypothetical protein
MGEEHQPPRQLVCRDGLQVTASTLASERRSIIAITEFCDALLASGLLLPSYLANSLNPLITLLI